MNNDIEKLANIFQKFPGIGNRQSKRFVYFLLKKDDVFLKNLSENILSIKNNISICSRCFRNFQNNGFPACEICMDSKTNTEQLLVVEKDSDMETIIKSNSYSGTYFVLGSLIPLNDRYHRDFTKIEEFKKRILNDSNIKEIILAFSFNPQGENTDLAIREIVRKIDIEKNIQVKTLGRGLSTGSELEYADTETITNAIKNRI